MGLFSDALTLVSYAIGVFAGQTQRFLTTLGIACILAALCWTAASNYSRLWNLRFQATRRHHILCGVAATFTLVAALLFAGLQYTKPAADRFIDNWKDVLTHNSQWFNATFNVAYEAVKALNLEPASNFRPPAEGLIPMSHSQSQKKVAEVYVNSAIGNFHASHPFLSTILRVPSVVPEDKITGEMKEFFRTNPGRLFPLEKAVDIAATEIGFVARRFKQTACFLILRLATQRVESYRASPDASGGSTRLP